MQIDSLILRFPDFKQKAVTFSYDDDVVFNERLIEIFKKYGVKATFNLNGGRFAAVTGERILSATDAARVFSNNDFEIAMHGYRHFSLAQTENSTAAMEILKDRETLENIFGRIIKGLAYGNGSFNSNVMDLMRSIGVKYARTIRNTHDFKLPEDFLAWHPTCHHGDPMLNELFDKFISIKQNRLHDADPLLFFMWGHAYEFNDKNNWYLIENFLDKVTAFKDELYFGTCGEIYDYVKGFNLLETSLDRTVIFNPTVYDYYLQINLNNVLVKSGETVRL